MPTVIGCATRRGRSPGDHGGIALFELGKLAAAAPHPVESEAERWPRFLVAAERLDPAQLPEWLETPELRQAMSSLTGFSEQERHYHAYGAGQNPLRQQRRIAGRIAALTVEAAREREEKEQARVPEARERLDKERERAEKEAALAEIEGLKALMTGGDHLARRCRATARFAPQVRVRKRKQERIA